MPDILLSWALQLAGEAATLFYSSIHVCHANIIMFFVWQDGKGCHKAYLRALTMTILQKPELLF